MCGADLSDICEEDLKKEKKDSEKKGIVCKHALNLCKDHSQVPLDIGLCFW
jgi:hypothetical protein